VDTIALRTVHTLYYADGSGTQLSSGHIALVTVVEQEGRQVGIANTHLKWDSPSTAAGRDTSNAGTTSWPGPKKLPKVLNPAPILRWNTDKRYLGELARAGLSVISTHFLEPGDTFEPPPAPFFIKPAVSCAAKDTARYEPGDTAALDHVQRLQSQNRTVMVQPYLSRIEAAGEVGVIFIDGAHSHSIRRGGCSKLGRSPTRPSPCP